MCIRDRHRIISDNDPQYIAKDFKTFIRISGMTHVRTAQYYPQSNGKIERWHRTMKSEALRPASPTSLEEARGLIERFVEYYNGVRLHSSIGYIAPLDFMDGKAPEIWSERTGNSSRLATCGVSGVQTRCPHDHSDPRSPTPFPLAHKQ